MSLNQSNILYDADIYLHPEFLDMLTGENPDCTKDELYDLAWDNREVEKEYITGELTSFSFAGQMLVIADLGLWHGRVQGYKLLDLEHSNWPLLEVLGSCDKIWREGSSLKARESHHDGTNYYEFYFVDPKTSDSMLNKICNLVYYNEPIPKAYFGRYLKKYFSLKETKNLWRNI